MRQRGVDRRAINTKMLPHLTREGLLRKQAAAGAPPTPSGSLPEVVGDPLWRPSHFVGTAREPGALREPGWDPCNAGDDPVLDRADQVRERKSMRSSISTIWFRSNQAFASAATI